jgi:hypothetical protein
LPRPRGALCGAELGIDERGGLLFIIPPPPRDEGALYDRDCGTLFIWEDDGAEPVRPLGREPPR